MLVNGRGHVAEARAHLQPEGGLEGLVDHLGGHLPHDGLVHAVLGQDVDGGGVQSSWNDKQVCAVVRRLALFGILYYHCCGLFMLFTSCTANKKKVWVKL